MEAMQDIKYTHSHQTKCGFIAVIGRPSAGKSTLLNTLCKHDASIVSQYPQTTRDIIRIIVSTDTIQYIFLDSPGYHISEKKYNKYLSTKVTHAIKNCDVILYLVDITRSIGGEEMNLINMLKKTSKPLVVAFTKIDLIHTNQEKKANNISLSQSEQNTIILNNPTAIQLSQRSPKAHFVTISALQKYGLPTLLTTLAQYLPKDTFHYPTDYYTDQESEFRICEQVRSAAIHFLSQELPHAIDTKLVHSNILNKNKEGKASAIAVLVEIIVDTKSQLAIVVGKGGSMIANIRKQASKLINDIFDFSIKLQLKVSVKKNWRNSKAK